MNTSLSVINTVLRWKVIPLQSLKVAIADRNNKTILNQVGLLKRKGRLHLSPLEIGRNNKLVYPTSKLIVQRDLTKELRVDEMQLTHDALVSSICLGMLDFSNFKEAMIEDYLYQDTRFFSKRGFYPDAILKGQRNNTAFLMPIEFEHNQKSESRIRAKFRFYFENSLYPSVLYFFLSEKLAQKYHEVLQETFSKAGLNQAQAKFIFAWTNPKELIQANLKGAMILTQGKLTSINSLWSRD